LRILKDKAAWGEFQTFCVADNSIRLRILKGRDIPLPRYQV